jgi:hypothetical protein
MNLTEYLSDSIDRIFREAVYSSLTNARESKFLLMAATAQKRVAKSDSNPNGMEYRFLLF